MSANDTIDDTAQPLIEHLKELRNRVLISISVYALCFILGYVIWQPIFNILSHPMCQVLAERGEECRLVLIKMQEGFFVAIRIALWGGFAMAFPIIAYQMWRFVAPGLYRSEKNAFLPFLVASPVMFFMGGAFAYFVILPFAFTFFLGFADTFQEQAASGGSALGAVPTGVVYQGSIEAYLSLTMTFVMAFGLCFQLPVLLTLMGRAGLISSRGLKHTRKYAVVGILAVSAIVTPPDIFSQIILFAAVYPLYEISILFVQKFERDREAQARADGTWVEDEEEGA
ncbi:twin-arginine translocase subunit TatC [Frigidibacter sp. SD6-1]|uniref:twin-arginine translocase subunit TatC n=1 Tax=Frigidibacter sp. SD6-1 TaxID=3032581 RepID=UPI0024DFD0D8|nr:twin-arginine translocase subunit TatC [Frigidibacter sp. SD6-1]